MQPFRVAVLGVVAVVAFDAVASVASLAAGFDYAYSAIGSCLIYAAFGFLVGRSSSIFTAACVGAVLGLADASLGWGVSWSIGPGRLPPGLLTATVWVGVA